MMSHPSPQKLAPTSRTSDPPNYDTWTREELIARLKELSESPTAVTTTANTPPASYNPPPEPKSSSPHQKKTKTEKSKREFNFSAYPTRKIALKFSYAGAGYGGLAWQAGPTPLPTVEGVLFAALAKARLVDPEGGFEACGWERCGRTDRGVSAAGQVVSLYVRSSNRPSPSSSTANASGTNEEAAGGTSDLRLPSLDAPTQAETETETERRSVVRYLHTLNGILPPSIRVYAWAPVAPTFSARFSCRARHYKYFFSARNLDVDAMRAGAARLVGEHDFRNLCKLDPAKQLTSFRRRILRADISPLLGNNDMHALDLVGTAFLYNQVRHIMAVLLLVGARLEAPRVVSALLNADPEGEEVEAQDGGEEPLPRVTCKPEYQMADALPLVLWDCAYDPEDARWRTDEAGMEGGSVGLYSQLVGLAERAQVEATLAEQFLAAASEFHGPAPGGSGEGGGGPCDVPLGGGMVRREGRYVRILKRRRSESVSVVNARWRSRSERREGKRPDK
ncbi:pseudouridine synthase [Lactifluus subvellereus]|nr:pseudouridine synthase [Lactifluus subvellereus]